MDFDEMKEKIENAMISLGNCRSTSGMTVSTTRFPNSNLEINLLKYDPSKDKSSNKREEFVAIWVGNQTSDEKPKKWQTDSVKKMGVVFLKNKASLITNHITLSRDSIEMGYETIGEALSREKRDLEDVITTFMSNRSFGYWEVSESLITTQLEKENPAFLDLYKFAIDGDKLPMQNREANATIHNQIARKKTLQEMLRELVVTKAKPKGKNLSLGEY